MAKTTKSEKWFLYMVRCSDDSIYTGITKNTEARIDKHNQGKGARFTASRRPVVLIYEEKHKNRISAMQRELEIKRWPRKKKEELSNRF